MNLWSNINGEVILLVFLPGLLFWDALDVNFRLFCVSFSQLITMAFPMVLAGATLTACVAFYIFPYDWSWMLCMTFGSILSATDPAAVAALLKEVGAPPRLKMHISGESMLNDGSAVVFYTVFSNIFLSELGIGLGETYSVGEGFALFFRMSLGGAAVGIAFGFGLVALLFHLNRRLDLEENVVQVATTATVAYLSFYTAEIVLGMSGVISVVLTGITASTFGGGMINSRNLMESFWHLLEYLLNTVLFTLGGIVWGSIISNSDERISKFQAKDWGFLFLLYVFVNCIRFFLMFAFYPLLSRVGLGWRYKEALFVSYSGLRGAVGIALAVSLDNEVFAATTEDDVVARDYTTTLFGHVGGIAFLTLWINGTLAGPLLKKLGLTKPTETRERVVKRFEETYYNRMLDNFIRLLADPRVSTSSNACIEAALYCTMFRRCVFVLIPSLKASRISTYSFPASIHQFRHADFAVISHHVPELKGLTVEELRQAVERNKDKFPTSAYQVPHLENVLSYLLVGKTNTGKEDENIWAAEWSNHSSTASDTYIGLEDYDFESIEEELLKSEEGEKEDPDRTKLTNELRLSFIDMVRASFERQVEKGELDARQEDGALYFALLQSCDFAADLVVRGHGLQGFEATAVAEVSWIDQMDLAARRLFRPWKKEYRCGERANSTSFRALRFDVYRSLAFIEAHRHAQQRFYEELFVGREGQQDENLAKRARLILFESEKEVAMAEDLLHSFDPQDVCVLISHLFCAILLNEMARDAERLQKAGILHEKEARGYLEEAEERLHNIEFCATHTHPGQHERHVQKQNDAEVTKMLDDMKSFSFQRRASQAVMDLEGAKQQYANKGDVRA